MAIPGVVVLTDLDLPLLILSDFSIIKPELSDPSGINHMKRYQ